MSRMILIFFQSFRDLFRPKIVALLFLPAIAGLLLWSLVGFFFWDQFLQLAQGISQKYIFTQGVPPWIFEVTSVTPEDVATFLAGATILVFLLPLTYLTSMLLTSVLAMPVVLSQLEKSFPDVEKKGSFMLVATTSNLVKSSALYLVLWCLTLPLWAIPGMTIALPLLLNGYLNYRLFIYDALGEFADAKEIEEILKRKKIDFLLLGVLIAALLLIPPLFLVVPVFGALCFARLAILELRDWRQQKSAP